MISGVPYSRAKSRGNKEAAPAWSRAIVEQTYNLPKVREACALKVTFLLPPDKYPADFPYGPDLDNLLKRLLDGLNETIFSETVGKDSCVVLLNVMKTKVESSLLSGAHIEVLPVSVS
jgi:Holliday junction resolvase RusA-like endonuclease